MGREIERISRNAKPAEARLLSKLRDRGQSPLVAFQSIPRFTEESNYPDPRIAWVRDALHLPTSTPFEEVNKIRAIVDERRKAIRLGEYELHPQDPTAGYFPQEYLTQFGDTSAAREHLVNSFARFALWEYIDQEGVGDIQDEEGSVRLLEGKLGRKKIAQIIEIYTNDPRKPDAERSMVDLLLTQGQMSLNRELDTYHTRETQTDKETADIVAIANKFPEGTQISIDDTATPTCTMPDGSMVRPVVGKHKAAAPYVVEYLTADGEEGTTTFSKDEVPPLDPVIARTMDILKFSHLYLWYMDRVKAKYEASDAPVAVSVADRIVAGVDGKNGNVYDVYGFKNFLEKVYGGQTESKEIK